MTIGLTLFATLAIRHRIFLTPSHPATDSPPTAYPVCAQSLTHPIGHQARHLRMFKSSMKIIQAKLFRRLRSSDLKGAGKIHA
jgi:hypothetical protein